MARRKHHAKKTTHRRRHSRKMGALHPGSMLTTIGGVVGGVAVAGLIVNKLLASQSETIKGIAPIVLGIATPMFLKSDLGKFAGAGMIAYGSSKFLAKYGIAGVGADAYEVSVSGVDNLSVVAGDGDFAMAGDDGYAMAGDEISVLA